MKELISRIKEHEGFMGTVYKCSEGFDTIGYGTRLPLSQEEAELLLNYRLKQKIKDFEQKEPFLNNLPLNKQEILIEMSYQMGVNGVLKFKKMWEALKHGDYQTASKEALNSMWAKQTPDRAKKLSDLMKA